MKAGDQEPTREAIRNDHGDAVVSVIIPMYQIAPFIETCVRSVQAQTYPHLEIILVDDGSTDGTGEIAQGLLAADPRIRLIQQENKGQADARNAGLDAATGSFVVFVDGDDWLDREAIGILMTLQAAEQADIVSGGFVRMQNETDPIPVVDPVVMVMKGPEALATLSDNLEGHLILVCGKLFRRHLFSGIRFPSGRVYEDLATTPRLVYRADSMVITTQPVLFYRQRPGSTMQRGFVLQSRLDALDAYRENAEFFRSVGLTPKADQTWKNLFLLYLRTFRQLRSAGLPVDDPRLQAGFDLVKKELVAGHQTGRFAWYFKIYQQFPGLADWLYDRWFAQRDQDLDVRG
jgi:glycosyltransferase involved in cell wall biosynthesis